MKTKIFILLAVLIPLLGIGEVKAQDTLWTKITGNSSWGQFTKDGTKVLFNHFNDSNRIVTQLLTADSGRVLWSDDSLGLYFGQLSPDSLYFLSVGGIDSSIFILVRRLSDGAIIKRYDTLLLNNIPRPLPYHWLSGDMVFSNDSRYLFIKFNEQRDNVPLNWVRKNFIFKIDLSTDRLIFVIKDSSINEFIMKPNENRLIIWKNNYKFIGFYDTDSLKLQKFYRTDESGEFQISRSGNYLTKITLNGDIFTWDTQQDSIIKRNHLDSISYLNILRYSSNDSVIVLLYTINQVDHFLVYNLFTNTKINDFEFKPLKEETANSFELSPVDSKLLVEGYQKGIYMYDLTLQPTAKKDDNNPATMIRVIPNPSLGKVGIEINLEQSEKLKISVYDSNGNLVKEISDGILIEGTNHLSFDSKNLPNGIYFVRVKGNNINQSTKLIINK